MSSVLSTAGKNPILVNSQNKPYDGLEIVPFRTTAMVSSSPSHGGTSLKAVRSYLVTNGIYLATTIQLLQGLVADAHRPDCIEVECQKRSEDKKINSEFLQ